MARSESKLRPAQRFIADLVLSTLGLSPLPKIPSAIVAADMGFGKTGAILTAIVRAFETRGIRKVLVVAPLLVAQVTWPDEIEEWEHTRDLTYTILRPDDDDPAILAAGTAAYDEAYAEAAERLEAERQENLALGMGKGGARKAAGRNLGKAASEIAGKARDLAVNLAKEKRRIQLAAEDTQIHLCPKEHLPWLFEWFGEKNWPYDFLVWDEPNKSGRKTASKGRAKPSDPLSRFGILCRVRKRMKAVVQLSGTPTPKGLKNLWALAYLCDYGERLGAAKTAFENRWFYNVSRGKFVKLKPQHHAFDEILGLVKDIMFSLGPQHLAELPQFVIDPVRVKLPAEVLRQYKQFQRDLVSEELDVESVNRGVHHNKLLQFANGSMYREDGSDVPIHDAKLHALQEIVERIDGAPLLVAYTYQFDLDRIKSKFPDAVVLNETSPRATVKLWNEGKIPMLLVHRLSAGHGLNLQYGSNHMCEYGLTSDLEQYLQFLKRLLRPGQLYTVFNHVIIAEGTIDEDVFPNYIDPKKEEQDRILHAVERDFDVADYSGPQAAPNPTPWLLEALLH